MNIHGVERFKNNKGDKWILKDLTTNEDGQIKVKVPSIGKYLITETKAPDGYTLANNSVTYNVTDSNDNEVTFNNKAKQKVTVHHYLKDAEGNATTVKIAEDEENIYDIGENYFTLPKMNLDNLVLEKDNEGNYIIPENATGVVGEEGNVVTYYYVVNPIKLTIHHYIDGTEEELVDDKVITYMPTINIEDNFVQSVDLTQSYNIKSNTDYNEILALDYELTYVTKDKELIEDETFTFVEDTELAYYYKKAKGTLNVNYLEYETERQLLDPESTQDKIGKDYNVEIKPIEDYTFVERKGDLKGKFEENTKTVKLYYKQSAQVTVNHIDRDTNVVLDTNTYQGLVGDEFTSTSKNFRKYILVESPENETVIMGQEEIVLNYYYIKVNAGVLEKHIDIVSEEILFNELHEGEYQEEYNISPRTFEGYDLVTDRLPENNEGRMGIDTIEVTYYYIAKTKVTVEYVNKLTGAKLIDDVVKNGHEGDDYTTENKEFTGFDLVKVPENAEGHMTKQDIVVTYEYQEISAGVVEKHIDVKTNQVLEQETYQGHVGDTYVTASKTIEGYDLVEDRLPLNAEGQMTKALIEVDYYYIAKTKVTVEYVNKLTGAKLIDDVVKNGHEGDDYTTENKTFTGFDLVKVPENAEGHMTKQDIVVTYEYQEISAGVVEKHIDVKTNQVLDQKTYQGHVGDTYVTTSKTIEGYDLVEDRLPLNAEGQMTKALIEVDYYYIAKTKVTVEYVNKLTGAKLIDDIVKNGHEGDDYTTENKEFTGFDLVKVPENAEGHMTKQDIVVRYEYQEISAGVLEKHIDALTNIVLDQKTYHGHIGDNYRTSAKQFEEYNLVEDRLPENAEGQMTKALIEVNYYYERKQGTVTVEYLEYGTNTSIKDSEEKKDRIGQSYTIEVPTIDKYTYVEKDGDLQGEFTLNSKIVKLYYKQNTKVIVNHIDRDTNEIMDTVTKDGLVGDEYTSTSKTFAKYILVDKPENETVIMTKDTIVLNYYYIKVSASVLEKHIDVISNEVLVEQLYEGTYGETYNITARTIAGYDLVEDRLPTNSRGTLGIDLIEVDYYYKKKAKVTVRLVDKITGQDIETPQELNLHQGDEYQVRVKEITGYDIVERPEGDKITINDDTTIIYYYKKKAIVETRYVDKDTGANLLDSIVIEGHEGDDYETEAKQIRKYNLLEVPENYKGKMTVKVVGNSIVDNVTRVTYYYEMATGKVNVEYLEYVSKRKLLEKVTKEDKLGKAYSVEIPTIEGYTYVEKEGDLQGVFEENEKTVKLYYKQNAQVIVNHIDKQSNVVMATNTYRGLVGDEFTSTSRNFARYVLVESPVNETVTMTKDPIILNYYYSKVSGGVIEKHIDVINNEILANEVHTGDNDDEYDIKPRTFTNYDLVEERLPTNAKGRMGVAPIEVTYYYISKAKVIVEYVNQLTGINLIDNIIKQGHEGDIYTTENKLFEGYKLVKLPTNANGKMTKDDIIVRYEYKQESAGVIEKHIDVMTNNLLDQRTYQGYVGDTYRTSSKTITGYDLMEDRLPENSEGQMTKDAIEVNYYYKKRAKVTVRLVDKITGKDIETPKELNLHQGDEYQVEVKEIEGYDIFERPEGDKVIINSDTTIIYYYKKKAKVETRYVDKATGKDLLDPVVIEGHEGDQYETEAKEIKYYKLTETPKNSKGTMHVETLENNGKIMFNDKTSVIYYYKAADFNLKVDKNITKVILDGETLKVSNGKLAKADVHRKKLDSSSIIVEYTLKVSNIGELAGGTTLKEDIPEGFTFKEESDSPWKLENGIAQLKIDELKPGEEKEFKVTLEWNKGEQNLGTKVNTASIIDETNEAKFNDSNIDDNESSATIIISIATGKEQLLATILIITIATAGISTFVVSKKRSKK